MSLIFGQRMVRLDDGQKGVVAQNGAELRIIYVDRGEERIALKSEKWRPDEIVPGPLRLEEKYLIAWHADRALKAYERHEPFKFWEQPRPADDAYDEGLIQTVVEYLTRRETRPATTE